MNKVCYSILFLLLSFASFGQFPKKIMEQMGPYPSVFLDSVEVDMTVVRKINPFDIATVSLLKPKKAKKLIGDKGADGAVYIVTVKAAKGIYWRYFSKKSGTYRQLFNTPLADSTVRYVLNGDTLSNQAAPAKLVLIANKKTFKRLQVIDQEKLQPDSAATKRYIVTISAKKPKGLIKVSTPPNN